MKYLFIFLFVLPPILLGQEYYQKSGVEGYILKANTLNAFKEDNFINPKIKDIDCFEVKLKNRTPNYYSDFYRQYYSRKIDGKEYLFIILVRKTGIDKMDWLKNERYIELDACESVRYIIYDIEKQEIIKDVNGGGCGA